MLISSENIAVSANSVTAQDDFLQRILSMKSIAGRAIEHFFRQKKEKKTVKMGFLGRCISLPSRTLLFFQFSIASKVKYLYVFYVNREKFKTKEWKEDAVIIL